MSDQRHSLAHTLCKKGGSLTLAAVLAGCAFISAPVRAAPVSPNAPVYVYFILNGIVRGSMMTGKLHPKDVHALMAVDEQARHIITQDVQHQTMKNDHQADVILERYLSLIPR